MNNLQNEVIHDYYLKNSSEINTLENLGKELDSNFYKMPIAKIADFYPAVDDIKEFPSGSWLLHIRFKLRKPYHSKDERISEYNNPILRDRLLGYPMVAPSTWKGNLRFAAGKLEGDNKKIVNRLFGPESDNDTNARKGRLYFYPTFFTGKVDKDVITPLSRKTRIPARGPIGIEVVPADETGDFYLLYFPYPKGKDWKPEEIMEDLKFTIGALKKMFIEYGFSAKKTSGFGVIHEKFEDFSLWWDGKNDNKNIQADKIKSFEDLEKEIIKKGGIK